MSAAPSSPPAVSRPLRPRQMDLASSDESEDDRNRTPPYGRQPQEDEDDEEEVVVLEEEEDATEHEQQEQGVDDDDDEDATPAALPVPDDLNALLCNIAAQLTVEFEDTVNSWLPEVQLTLTAVPDLGSGPDPDLALTLTTLLALTLTGLVGGGCDASLREAPCLVRRRPAAVCIRGSAERATAAGLRGQRLRVQVSPDQSRAGARAASQPPRPRATRSRPREIRQG